MLTNHCMYLQWYLELLSTRCGFDSRTGRCGMISRNREIIPFFIANEQLKKDNVINLKAEDIYSEMDQISSAFFDMLIL